MNTKWISVDLKNPDHRADALAIFHSNDDYFLLSGGKKATVDSLAEICTSPPPQTTLKQKKVLLVYEEGMPLALLDLIQGYPSRDCAYIGLLIVHGDRQNKGWGLHILQELEQRCAAEGYVRLRLGVLSNNPGALAFWTKMGFTEQLLPKDNKAQSIQVMEKMLIPTL